MKSKIIIFAVIFFMSTRLFGQDSLIFNKDCKWGENDKFVITYFDLAVNAPHTYYNISFKATLNDKEVKASTLTGDIGNNIESGKGKQITWDILTDIGKLKNKDVLITNVIVEKVKINYVTKFRKTLGPVDNLKPAGIIKGHDGRYVVFGTINKLVNAYFMMYDSLGNIIPGFPVILPNESKIKDVIKVDQGYVSIGEIDKKPVLVALSKDAIPLKSVDIGNGYLSSVVKSDNGYIISSTVLNNSGIYNRCIVTTDLFGDNGKNTIFSFPQNQYSKSMLEDNDTYITLGFNDNKDVSKSNIILSFIKQSGDENRFTINSVSDKNEFPYGLTKYENGYAILGKYDNFSEFTECFLVLCDKNGNKKENSIQHLKVFADETNFWSSGIISTAEGGFAIVGQSKSKNIVLLIFDKDGNQKPNSPIEFNHYGEQNAQDLIQAPDGSYIIVGTTSENRNQNLLIFKVKIIDEIPMTEQRF